jgi:hypothetical protein
LPITKPLRCSSVGMQRWNRELAAAYEGRAESCPSGFFIQAAQRPYSLDQHALKSGTTRVMESR